MYIYIFILRRSFHIIIGSYRGFRHRRRPAGNKTHTVYRNDKKPILLSPYESMRLACARKYPGQKDSKSYIFFFLQLAAYSSRRATMPESIRLKGIHIILFLFCSNWRLLQPAGFVYRYFRSLPIALRDAYQ